MSSPEIKSNFSEIKKQVVMLFPYGFECKIRNFYKFPYKQFITAVQRVLGDSKNMIDLIEYGIKNKGITSTMEDQINTGDKFLIMNAVMSYIREGVEKIFGGNDVEKNWKEMMKDVQK